MITGFNNEVIRRDAILHVQTEDKGKKFSVIDTLVYKGGKIIYHEKSSYDPSLRNSQIKELLQAQHERVIDKIKRGELDDKIFEDDTQYIRKKGEKKESGEKELDEEIIQLLNTDKELVNKEYGAELIIFSCDNRKVYVKLRLFFIDSGMPVENVKVKVIFSDRKKNVVKSIITGTKEGGVLEVEHIFEDEVKIYWLQLSINGNMEGEIYLG